MTNFSELSPGSIEPRKEQTTPPAERKENALADFARSIVYSAVEAPLQGVAQIVDVCAGTNFENSKAINFIAAPETAKFGTLNWVAQATGGAIGMILPFKLVGGASRYALGFKAADEALPLAMSMRESMVAMQAPKVVQPQDDAPRRNVPVVPPALRIQLPKAA